jgi:hypothetical protein
MVKSSLGAHPEFSKQSMFKRRQLNAVVEKELEGPSDMQECFWDLFNVVEEAENKQTSNYPSLPFTPVTINGKLVNALVDSGANPSYVSTKWTIYEPSVPTVVSRAGITEKTYIT